MPHPHGNHPIQAAMDVPMSHISFLIDDALALVQSPDAAFVRDFLFHYHDLPMNIASLANTTTQAHASLTLSSVFADALFYHDDHHTLQNPTANHHLAPFHTQKFAFLLPSHTIGNFILGTCCVGDLTAPGEAAQGPGPSLINQSQHHHHHHHHPDLGQVAVGRFVHNVDTAESITLVQTLHQSHTDHTHTALSRTRHLSSTVHENISFLCETNLFRTKQQQRAHSVILVNYAIEQRPCPVCSALPVMRCTCTLQISPPHRHPIGLHALVPSVQTHYAPRWNGTSTLILRNDAVNGKQPFMGFNMFRSHAFLPPPDLELSSRLASALFEAGHGRPAHLGLVQRAMRKMLGNGIQPIGRPVGSLHGHAPSVQPPAVSRSTFVLLEPIVHTKLASDHRLATNPVDSVGRSGQTLESSPSKHIDHGDPDDRSGLSRPEETTSSDSGRRAVQESKYPRGFDGDGHSSTLSRDLAAVRPKVELTLRDIKAVQRKQKNREAAARSNEKRKQRMMNLRRDVSCIRLVFSDLSARERALRQENLALRAKLKILNGAFL